MNHLEVSKLAGIYKITNLVNGKIYIGKSWNMRTRIFRHGNKSKGDKSLDFIHRSIKKHGLVNFKVDVLEAYPCPGESINQLLLERESFWIRFYESHRREKGYNCLIFGTSRTGYKASDETRRKQSLAAKGRRPSENAIQSARERCGEKHPNYRKIVSLETKAKLSASLKGRIKTKEHREALSKSQKGKRLGEKAFWYGRKHSAETIQKLKDNNYQRGKPINPKTRDTLLKANKRPIFQLDSITLEVIKEFESIQEAALEITGKLGSRKAIGECVNGKRKTALGFSWRFKSPETNIKYSRKPVKQVKVDQYSLESNEYIRTWNSVTEAAKAVGVSGSSIFGCLRGRSKKSGGFFWRRTQLNDDQII